MAVQQLNPAPEKRPPIDIPPYHPYDYGDDGGLPPIMLERISKIEEKLEHLQKEMDRNNSAIESMRNDYKYIRRWIIGTFIATLAVIVAFWQWQGSWFQNSLSIIQSATRQQIDGFTNLIEANQAANKQQLDDFDKRWSYILQESQKRYEEEIKRLDSKISLTPIKTKK